MERTVSALACVHLLQIIGKRIRQAYGRVVTGLASLGWRPQDSLFVTGHHTTTTTPWDSITINYYLYRLNERINSPVSTMVAPVQRLDREQTVFQTEKACLAIGDLLERRRERCCCCSMNIKHCFKCFPARERERILSYLKMLLLIAFHFSSAKHEQLSIEIPALITNTHNVEARDQDG